jgi:deazaflavin-dependent oxidoreductase (nitroreductase family)
MKVGGFVDLDRVFSKLNPLMVFILESRMHWPLSSALMVVHVVGRRSGRKYKIPVGYQRNGSEVSVLVSKSTRKNWWRNYRKQATVNVTLKGKVLSGFAVVVDKESDKFREQVNDTLKRLPGLSKQFGIDSFKGGDIESAELSLVKADAELVSIAL